LNQLKLILPLILILTTSFTSVFADGLNIQPISIQEQIIQKITSLLHFKSGYMPIELSEKQIVEYSLIGAISIVIIIAIASSVRTKNKKSIRK
jgi:hypothetical protein